MKRDEIIPYLFVLLATVFYSINGAWFFSKWMQGLMYGAVIVGIVSIVYSFKSSIKSFLWLAIITLGIFFLFIQYSDTRMMLAIIGILVCYNLDKNHMLKNMLHIKMFCFLCILLAGGYRHINGAAVQAGVILLLYICTKQKINLQQYIFVIAWYVFFALYTKSGSFGICIITGILLMILCQLEVGKKICRSKVVWFIYPICMFLNYFLVVGIGEPKIPFIGDYLSNKINAIYIVVIKFLDEFMSYRLSLANYSLGKFGVSFFGGNVDYSLLDSGIGYFHLDSGYFWLLQGFGIIMTVLFLIISVILMRYFCETQKYYLIISGIVIALWSVNEDVLVGIGINFLLLYFGEAIDYQLNRERKNEYT